MMNITHVGRREVWGGDMPFGLSDSDRRRHVYAVGKTGSGKTTLLRNLIIQDIAAGHGVGVIDPHGDLAEELLDCIPSWRLNDVVYFDPADLDYPTGFNLVHSTHPNRNFLEASSVVGAFKHLWRESWGPRLEYVLYASVAALMECENVSLLGLPRMLVDVRYRRWVLKQVKDPMVHFFWEEEFGKLDKRFIAEIIAPIQNKVGQVLMAAPLRNVFGQVKSAFDPRFIMDKKRIFIANLSKGRLGEDKTNLLGSLLVSKFYTAAMERSDTPEEKRVDFHLFIDEFHNFSTDSFAGVLSEARKYRLNLTLAHQYLGQMSEEVRAAVFGNIGTLFCFRVGSEDAEIFAKEFGGSYAPSHFTDLANYELLAKMLENEVHYEPFRAKAMPPISSFYGHAGRIKRRSRERFAKRREVVEGKIRRWMEA